MLNKIAMGAVILGLCSHGCLAQISKPSSVIAPPRTAPLVISSRLFPSRHRSLPLTLFPEFRTPPQAWDSINMNWGLSELTSQLSCIHAGMPLHVAVQRMQILGGVKDGGAQTIPITRYFFKPGVIVNIPENNGYVTGPPRIALGQFHLD